MSPPVNTVIAAPRRLRLPGPPLGWQEGWAAIRRRVKRGRVPSGGQVPVQFAQHLGPSVGGGEAALDRCPGHLAQLAAPPSERRRAPLVLADQVDPVEEG